MSDAWLIAAVSIRVSPLHNFDCCIPELDLMAGGRGAASITTVPNRRARVLLGIVGNVNVKCVTNNLATLTSMRELKSRTRCMYVKVKNMNVTGHKVVDSSPVEGVNCSPDLAYFSPLLLRHFLAAKTFPPLTQCSWGRPALMSFY